MAHAAFVLFALFRPVLGSALKWFAVIYFLGMLARYVISMVLFPERRWFGGTIPIFFHWVLALYVYLLSRYYRGFSLGLPGTRRTD